MSDGVRGSWGGGSLLEPSAPMLLSTNCCLSACDELFMSKESDDAWRLEGRKGLAVHGVRTKLVECLLAEFAIARQGMRREVDVAISG